MVLRSHTGRGPGTAGAHRVTDAGWRPSARGRHARGFTLVEATIVVAILALAMGVTVANFSSGKADLRKISGKLAGTVRATYDSASLSGQTYRMVFSFEKPVVRVEATEQLLSFDEDSNPLARGAKALDSGPAGGGSLSGLLFGGMAPEGGDEVEKDLENFEPPPAVQALLGLSKEGESEATAGFKSTGHDLPLEDVKLLDVWVSGMEEPASEGEIYLYFFPNGYTQDAVIHLQDADSAVFSVKIEALTGRAEVLDEYVEPPK